MTTKIESIQTFKILIIGESGVGKSSLMNRFVHGVFNIHFTATIGIDFKVAIVNIGDYKCRLQIWDTAGQERFRSLASTYYRGADGVIIVYDVTNIQSFEQIKIRLAELEFYCDESVPKILVGNKDDDDNDSKKKVVLSQYAQELATQNNLLFFEASVKDNKNIAEIFNKLTKLVLQRRLDQCLRMVPNGITLEEQKTIKKKDKKKWFCVI